MLTALTMRKGRISGLHLPRLEKSSARRKYHSRRRLQDRAPLFLLHPTRQPFRVSHRYAALLFTHQPSNKQQPPRNSDSTMDDVSMSDADTDSISPVDSPETLPPGAFQVPSERTAPTSPERHPPPPPIPTQRAEVMAESASPIGIANVCPTPWRSMCGCHS